MWAFCGSHKKLYTPEKEQPSLGRAGAGAPRGQPIAQRGGGEQPRVSQAGHRLLGRGGDWGPHGQSVSWRGGWVTQPPAAVSGDAHTAHLRGATEQGRPRPLALGAVCRAPHPAPPRGSPSMPLPPPLQPRPQPRTQGFRGRSVTGKPGLPQRVWPQRAPQDLRRGVVPSDSPWGQTCVLSGLGQEHQGGRCRPGQLRTCALSLPREPRLSLRPLPRPGLARPPSL